MRVQHGRTRLECLRNKERVDACQGVQMREMPKRYIHLKLKTKFEVDNFNFQSDVKPGPSKDNEVGTLLLQQIY